MKQDGGAGTTMLELPGWPMSSAFGELEQAVETTTTAAGCQGCGVAARPMAGAGVGSALGWSAGHVAVGQRLWRCAGSRLHGQDLVRPASAYEAGPA